MYIKEITKNTSFVKKYNDKEDTYIVEEKEYDGVVTVSITKDPCKAKVYTINEAYKDTYNNLEAHELKEMIDSYNNPDNNSSNYYSLSAYVGRRFKAISAESVYYGYDKDNEADRALIKIVDMEYIFPKPVSKVIVEDTDNE